MPTPEQFQAWRKQLAAAQVPVEHTPRFPRCNGTRQMAVMVQVPLHGNSKTLVMRPQCPVCKRQFRAILNSERIPFHRSNLKAEQ
jgi:transposase-like protein